MVLRRESRSLGSPDGAIEHLHKMTGLRQLAILAFLCAPMLQAMPVLGVSSSQFVFGVAPGSNPFPQNFRIFNKGDGTLNVAASVPSNFPWLNVSLSSGSGSVSINSTTLAVGIYAGTFTLSDPSAADSPRTMSVTLNVTSQLVTIPTTLAVFVTPQTATFRDIYLPLQSIATGNIPA